MRAITAAILALAVSSAGALAATDSAGALAPGKPAGVKEADRLGPNFLLIAGIAVVAVGIGLVVSNSGGNNAATSTSGTAP